MLYYEQASKAPTAARGKKERRKVGRPPFFFFFFFFFFGPATPGWERRKARPVSPSVE